MRINERMDEGDILLQRATPIGADETAGALQERLATLGAAALMEALQALPHLTPVRQDDARASLAPLLRKEQGAIEWQHAAEAIARQVRGLNPWPSAYTTLAGKLVKLHRARAVAAGVTAAPGTVVAIGDTICVACGSGVLAIDELQLEGRRALGAAAFARGGELSVGDRFGAPADDR
jgi:methionyl-tRNA formyltransferase